MRRAGVWLLVFLPGIGVGQQGDTRFEVQSDRPAHWVVPASPALEPTQALGTLRAADGFAVQLAASEPMVQDPILGLFDERGRMWVLEMRGFMPDVEGRGEDAPAGRVSVLEDTDRDGRMDRAHVYLEGLVMPRVLARVGEGVLVTSGGKLLYAPDRDDDGRADGLEEVDGEYATTGNVEHQPNGMLRGLDNWYYNAKSRVRYRRVEGRWYRDRTEFRGQWGITQDDEGRLFYNVNYSQLHGDLVPPNYFGRNPAYFTANGLNVVLTTNQQVFPVRMNTGVNRAYRPGVLDENGRLREFTSASAPWVYRGVRWPEMVGDVFVCEPAGNLMKRNRVVREGLGALAEPMYPASEFLASTDERFRPVSLFGGPDGALWVVDMYRGIVQHREYVTSFLRREILARGLESPVHLGRIYRIVPAGADGRPAVVRPGLGAEAEGWVSALADDDGWRRDQAQRLLVERGRLDVLEALITAATASVQAAESGAGGAFATHGLGRVHALWTIEGLVMRGVRVEGERLVLRSRGVSDAAVARLRGCLGDADPRVRKAALRVLESLAAGNLARQRALFAAVRDRLARERDESVRFQALLTMGGLDVAGVEAELVGAMMADAASALLRDAVLTSPLGRELEMIERWVANPAGRELRPGREAFLQALASAVVKRGEVARVGRLLELATAMARANAGWGTAAMLAGWLENVPELRVTPLGFQRRPRELSELRTFEAGRFAKAVERIEAVTEWPEHQVERVKPKLLRPLNDIQRQFVESGRQVFLQICAGCHGANGEGLDALAPPLLDSEIVAGPKKHLILLVLHGIEGPVTVAGREYRPPAVQPNMPSLEAMSDMQLGAVLSYVRRVFGRVETLVSPNDVAETRQGFSGRAAPWTQAELLRVDPALRTVERW